MLQIWLNWFFLGRSYHNSDYGPMNRTVPKWSYVISSRYYVDDWFAKNNGEFSAVMNRAAAESDTSLVQNEMVVCIYCNHTEL